MGYMNPIESMGSRAFRPRLREAGIVRRDLLTGFAARGSGAAPRVPSEGLDLVPLIAPTTSANRAARIARAARGFVYYVSVTGVTGVRAAPARRLEARLRASATSPRPRRRRFRHLPPRSAAALKGKADGVVVGTALVATHHEQGINAAAALVRSLRSAL